jgi:hypothetical protein
MPQDVRLCVSGIAFQYVSTAVDTVLEPFTIYVREESLRWAGFYRNFHYLLLALERVEEFLDGYFNDPHLRRKKCNMKTLEFILRTTYM